MGAEKTRVKDFQRDWFMMQFPDGDFLGRWTYELRIKYGTRDEAEELMNLYVKSISSDAMGRTVLHVTQLEEKGK